MDENYENRPPAKNSGLATAKKAGVKDKDKKQDKETEAFLASVRHSPSSSASTHTTGGSSKNKAVYVKTKPQSAIPPPPKSGDDSSSSGSVSSASSGKSNSEANKYNNSKEDVTTSTTKTQPYHSKDLQSAQDNKNEENSSAKWSGFQYKQSNETKHSTSLEGEKSMSESIMNMNAGLDDDRNDDLISGVHQKQTEAYSSSYTATHIGRESEFDSIVNSFDNVTFSKPINSGEASTRQSIYSSKTLPKQSSVLSPSSAFDQSMTTKDVKSVYKDAFFRWNHPFRHDELEEINGGFDIPVFWRIPRSASGVVEATMSYCYGLTLANALGAGFQDEV